MIPLNWPVVQLDAFHQTLMVLISFHADQIFHGWFCSLLVHSHVDLLLVAHSYVCFCQIFNRGVTELDCSITFTELAVAQNDSAITVITTLWNCNGGDAIFLTFDYKAMVTVMPLFLSFDLRWTLFQHEASWWFPPDCESPVRVELSFWDSDSKDLAQNWIKKFSLFKLLVWIHANLTKSFSFMSCFNAAFFFLIMMMIIMIIMMMIIIRS